MATIYKETAQPSQVLNVTIQSGVFAAVYALLIFEACEIFYFPLAEVDDRF